MAKPTLSDFCKHPTDTPEGLDQHAQCRGRCYIWPPRDGKVTVVCGCAFCKHPAVWRGRPPVNRPGRPASPRRGRGSSTAEATGSPAT